MSKATTDPIDELKKHMARTMSYDGNRTVKDVLTSAAKRGNIDPSFLFSSAWQEGFNLSVLRPGEASQAYDNAQKKDKSLNDYPIDGFYNYGLDTFGDNYDKLKKYLPEGFEKNIKFFDAFNEKNQKVKTVAFKNNEDALVAKAAYLNSMRSDVNDYAKKKGLEIDDRTGNYFTLASYNGGFGNARKIIDQYSASSDREHFIDKGLTQQGQIHKNIYPRIERQGLVDQILNEVPNTMATAKIPKQEMTKGGKIRPKYDDGGEIDPITGKPKGPTLDGAVNKGIDVFGNALNSEVPINPNAPADEQIFKINEQGQAAVPAEKIIPLAQFADQVAGRHGQTNLNPTGQYVNDQGQFNTLSDAEKQADDVSQKNIGAADAFIKNQRNVEFAASAGITAINSFFNKKEEGKERKDNTRKAIMQQSFAPTFNPYAEGTGSQAIMEGGGKISGDPVKGYEGGVSAGALSIKPKSPQEVVYNTLIDKGINSQSAKLMVAQMMHESKNFTSNVFKTDNNPMGMKIPRNRETLVAGPGKTKAPGKNGDIGAYARFDSLSDAAKDLLLWQKDRGLSLIHI